MSAAPEPRQGGIHPLEMAAYRLLWRLQIVGALVMCAWAGFEIARGW
jgi:hypothetical protein